jgi:tetratricopeptide (TPR) repeat protein
LEIAIRCGIREIEPPMTPDENATGADEQSTAITPLPSVGVSSRRRRRWLLPLLAVLAVGAVAGWYFWQLYDYREPPTVDLAGADDEVAAAISNARAEVLRSSRSPAAWGKLGKVLAAHRYLDEARSCFSEAERRQPQEPRWPYFQGLMLVFSDNDAAILQFQRAVQLPEARPAMRFRLAETLVTQGRFDEAEGLYRTLLDDPALSTRAELGLGRVAFQRGNLDAARGLLDRVATQPGAVKAAHSLLAEIAQRSNDSDAAARERAIVAKLPNDPEWADPLLDEITREKVGRDARLARALELSRQHRTGDAATAFQDLVKAYPDWDQSWLNYGRLLMDNRAYQPAEQAFRMALRLAPDSVSGHYQLGVVLFQRDAVSDAAAEFRETTRLKPDHALAHYNLGQSLKRLGDRPGALAAFRQAIRFRPDMARAHTSLGELLAEQGDKSAAVEEARLSLDLNPDDEAAKKLRERLGKSK